MKIFYINEAFGGAKKSNSDKKQNVDTTDTIADVLNQSIDYFYVAQNRKLLIRTFVDIFYACNEIFLQSKEKTNYLPKMADYYGFSALNSALISELEMGYISFSDGEKIFANNAFDIEHFKYSFIFYVLCCRPAVLESGEYIIPLNIDISTIDLDLKCLLGYLGGLQTSYNEILQVFNKHIQEYNDLIRKQNASAKKISLVKSLKFIYYQDYPELISNIENKCKIDNDALMKLESVSKQLNRQEILEKYEILDDVCNVIRDYGNRSNVLNIKISKYNFIFDDETIKAYAKLKELINNPNKCFLNNIIFPDNTVPTPKLSDRFNNLDDDIQMTAFKKLMDIEKNSPFIYQTGNILNNTHQLYTFDKYVHKYGIKLQDRIYVTSALKNKRFFTDCTSDLLKISKDAGQYLFNKNNPDELVTKGLGDHTLYKIDPKTLYLFDDPYSIFSKFGPKIEDKNYYTIDTLGSLMMEHFKAMPKIVYKKFKELNPRYTGNYLYLISWNEEFIYNSGGPSYAKKSNPNFANSFNIMLNNDPILKNTPQAFKAMLSDGCFNFELSYEMTDIALLQCLGKIGLLSSNKNDKNHMQYTDIVYDHSKGALELSLHFTFNLPVGFTSDDTPESFDDYELFNYTATISASLNKLS